jgi:hypothetical protein
MKMFNGVTYQDAEFEALFGSSRSKSVQQEERAAPPAPTEPVLSIAEFNRAMAQLGRDIAPSSATLSPSNWRRATVRLERFAFASRRWNPRSKAKAFRSGPGYGFWETPTREARS